MGLRESWDSSPVPLSPVEICIGMNMTDGINAISLSSAEKLKLCGFKTRRHQLFPSSVSFYATVVPLSAANVFKNCFEKLGKLQVDPVFQYNFQMTF